MKTTEELIKSAARELALRRNVYPKFLREGRKGFTEASVAHEIACQEEIIALLKERQGREVTRERQGFEPMCPHCWLGEALNAQAAWIKANVKGEFGGTIDELAENMGRLIGEIIVQWQLAPEEAIVEAVEGFEHDMREAIRHPKPAAPALV